MPRSIAFPSTIIIVGLLCLGATGTAAAGDDPHPDFAATSEGVFADQDLDPELEFFVAGRTFFDGEMGDAYGLMPAVGAGISCAINPDARFFAGLSFARTKGDPFHDVADFDGEDLLELRVVPLTFGVRFNGSQARRLRLNVELAVQAVFLREELPDGDEGNGNEFGFLFMTGPEWRFDDGDRAVGLQLGVAVAGHNDRDDPPLSGLNLKLYTVLPL